MAAQQNQVKKPAKKSTKKSIKKSAPKRAKLSTEIKHEKFCAEYRKNGGNATAAAIAAGYSKKTAAAQGSRLLKNVKIQNRIEQMAKDTIRKNIITADERAVVLSDIARNDKAEDNARIRAIDTLNKMDGIYVFKAEVKVTGGLAAIIKARRSRSG